MKKYRQSVTAADRDRTGDLFLTKEVLYQLSYSSTGVLLRCVEQQGKASKFCDGTELSNARPVLHNRLCNRSPIKKTNERKPLYLVIRAIIFRREELRKVD